MIPELQWLSESPALASFFAEWLFNLRGGAFNGTVMRLTPMARTYLTNNRWITAVEVDANATTSVLEPLAEAAASTWVTQGPGAPWHLDRLDTHAHDFDGRYNYTNTGAGVDVYMIDTGINTAHTEFSGRLDPGINFAETFASSDVEDCMGHGTHVAGRSCLQLVLPSRPFTLCYVNDGFTVDGRTEADVASCCQGS